jgi:hypothetical protein
MGGLIRGINFARYSAQIFVQESMLLLIKKLEIPNCYG